MKTDVNKMADSDKTPCNNGKAQRYILGLQRQEKMMMMMMMMMIPLFIKTHEDLLSYGASQHDKGLPYTINFTVGTDYNVQ